MYTQNKSNMKNVYFIETIQSYRTAVGKDVYTILFEHVDAQGEQVTFSPIEYEKMPTLKGTDRKLHEGQYVYYDTETRQFTPAYNDPLARTRQRKNFYYRNRLYCKQNPVDAEQLGEILAVQSYHVNVGHGNCSILLVQYRHMQRDEYQIWMVDCGAIDYGAGNRYPNIDACFADIALRLHTNPANLKISRFFLTHWHYDHISGIPFLIRNGYINQDTKFYLNLYYAHSSRTANKVLQMLDTLGTACYEPVIGVSINSWMSVLYPECRIRKQQYNEPVPNRVEKKMNNSSVVYAFQFWDKQMIYPGDLEQDGWNVFKMQVQSMAAMSVADYYCVSHHGSDNGHVVVPNRLQKVVLMGRDGAFNGIYSPMVMQYWNPVLSLSEWDTNGQASRAVVLDLTTGEVRYIY